MSAGSAERVLVTGASGFIGGAVVRRLLAAGYVVRGNGRSRHAPQYLLDAAQACGGRFEWHPGDLVRPHGLASAFEGASMVVHAAAIVDSAAPTAAIEQANVTATQHVCELSKRAGVKKLVYVGTSDVFGIPLPGEIITEDTPYRFWGESYPDTKIAATRLVRRFRAEGLVSTIIHPGWAYGPGDRAFFPKLIEQVKFGLMPDWSPKSGQIALIYIEDLVDALCLAVGSSHADNGDLLILDDNSGVRLPDICRYIADRIGRRCFVLPTHYAIIHALARVSQIAVKSRLVRTPLLTTTDAKSFGHEFRFSVEKARHVLGWAPRTSVKDGLEAALDALMQSAKSVGRAADHATRNILAG